MSSSFPSTDDHLSFNGFLDNILVDFPPQNPVIFSSGSDITRKTNSSSSGSDDGDTNQWEVNPIDERKRKRMISNRESARRSRMRKQKHMENLRNQVNRYKTGNQDLIDWLRFVNHKGKILRQENQRLRLESVMLQQKLDNLHQLLVDLELHYPLLPSAWPCNNNVTIISDQNQPTLITF